MIKFVWLERVYDAELNKWVYIHSWAFFCTSKTFFNNLFIPDNPPNFRIYLN